MQCSCGRVLGSSLGGLEVESSAGESRAFRALGLYHGRTGLGQ